MTAGDRCSCSGLRKKYGRLEVLKGCSFLIRSGELVGITGENGSGKTTLVRCLLGFTRPTAGVVWLDSSVGYCPQDNYLGGQLTLSEHLRLCSAILDLGGEVYLRYRDELLDTLKLHEFMGRRIGQLSGGTIQKAKFLTSILHRPRLVVLDEPTDGFDWAMYLAYWDIISRMSREGTAVLMISHMVYDRKRFDRLYEIREGALAETVAKGEGAGVPA
jgi:ABC-2 type transport system ATP-binding protein